MNNNKNLKNKHFFIVVIQNILFRQKFLKVGILKNLIKNKMINYKMIIIEYKFVHNITKISLKIILVEI